MLKEIKVPSPGESITEVQIANWLKNDGDYVEKDEELAEIDSDKATLTIAAEESGLLKVMVAAGETVAVGSIIATINTEADKPDTLPDKTESKHPSPPPVALSEPKKHTGGTPSPLAAKMMAEKNIAPSEITGSGSGGRITRADVLAHQTTSTKANAVPLVAASSADKSVRSERREKMSMLRKKISQRLVAVKNETAMLTTFNEVDMSAIISIRKQYKDHFKETHGVGLGFMSFFTKAVCIALNEFPSVNGMIDGEEIVYHNFCDIGIAVSAPKGLMVPVIRDAETLSLAEIESAVMSLAGKAREGKISLEEMTGGTFTITNGGVFGSMLSTPIINPPQSAILGMHNVVERPVAINGKVAIRPVMYVALSYDHRIIDGRESVSFLMRIKQLLEEPVKMILDGKDPVKMLLGI